MAKIATKLLIAFTFLLIFFGFFIYWQRSSIAALIAYQLLKSEGVYAIDVEIENINLAAIDIKKVIAKVEGHPFHTTIELNQLRCQLIFYDLLSPICAPLHIQNLSIRANNRETQTPPPPELVLAIHDRVKQIATHPMLSQKTQIEQLHLYIEPYGLQTLEMTGNLRIEAGQVYLYYQPLKFSFLPFEIKGHLYLLNEQSEMALKTEKSHLKTQWVILKPSQRIQKQLHITANGHLDLTEYQTIHQKLHLRPAIESTGFVQLDNFDLNMPMEFDAQVFKSGLFRLKTNLSVDGALTLQDQALSKIHLLSDLVVDYSAEQMNIRCAASDASAEYTNTRINIHSSDEYTLSWNGNNHWHLNIQSPIHWAIEQKKAQSETAQPETAQPETAQPETAQPETAQPENKTIAKGMAENITFYQGNQTHLQFTLFNEESTTLALKPETTETLMTLPPYQMTARIDQDSKKWLFDISMTKLHSNMSANLNGVYQPENHTWQHQIKIESALTEITPLLLLLDQLQDQQLFALPRSLVKQFSEARLFYQSTLQGQLQTSERTETADFFTSHFWQPFDFWQAQDWVASHHLTLDDAQSNQPWLRWNQIHLELTDQKPASQIEIPKEIQQTGHYVLKLKQSHLLKSLTDGQIEGDFHFKADAPFAHFERSKAIFNLWHGQAKITEAFSWSPEKASQWTLELSPVHINELFKLQKSNHYTLHPDLAVGSLVLNASPHFQTMAIQAILTTKNHSDLTDKVNHEHFSLPFAQFNFEVDEKYWMKLTLVTQKEGSHAPLLLYSTPLQHSTPQHP